ncbi:unnamed protein product [Closterium sp. NIES-53]
MHNGASRANHLRVPTSVHTAVFYGATLDNHSAAALAHRRPTVLAGRLSAVLAQLLYTTLAGGRPCCAWSTEHPSRPVSPRPVRNEGGIDDEVDGGAQVSDNNGTKQRGVIKVNGGVDRSQAQVQQTTAAAGSLRADVDGQRRSHLRSGGGLSATTHLEVAGLKGFADGTMPIPFVDDVGLRGEFCAAHLLTFIVISRCCSPVVKLALRSCRERLDAGHQAWHFILSTYQVRDDLHIAQLEEKMTHIRMGEQESGTDYCNRA